MRVALLVASLVLVGCTTSSGDDAAVDLSADAPADGGADLSACVEPPPASAACAMDAGYPGFTPAPCDGLTRASCGDGRVVGCLLLHAGCLQVDGGNVCLPSTDYHGCTSAAACSCGAGHTCPPGQLCVSPVAGGPPRCACAADVTP